jgi:hypothetical protein
LLKQRENKSVEPDYLAYPRLCIELKPYKKDMSARKSMVFISLWMVLVFVLSYLFSYPFDIFSRGAFSSSADTSLAMWIFDWQLSRLSHGNFAELFTGNMFYPLENSVVFSINMLSTVILNVPLFWITGNPEISFNASIYFSYILSALGMFFLARRLQLDMPSAIVASLIFTFSEFRLYFSSHLTLLAMQWMPLTFLSIHKYIDEGKKVNLYWASLFFCLQILASAHYAILFSLILLVFITIIGSQQNFWSWKKIYIDALGPAIMALIAGIGGYFPYWKVSQNFGISRPFSEQIRYGADLDTYLSAAHSYFLGPLTSRFGHIEGQASPRFTAIFLTAAAVILYRTQVAHLSFIRKLDLALIVMLIATFFTWETRQTWTPGVVEALPFARNWDPLVWKLIILTPVTWLTLIRISLTRIVRSLIWGLRSQNIFFLYFIVAFIAFLISLGPVIKISGFEWALNPVTTFLFFTFPGFDSIRAISRMSGLVPLGLAITAGMGLMLLGKKFNTEFSKNIFYFFIITILLLEIFPAKGINKPYKKKEIVQAEYIWLKDQAGEGPVLEWPVYSPFDGETLYVERSIIHKKPLVNGYASFQWNGHKKLSKMKDLSRQETLLSLYAFGVRHLFIHKVEGQFPKWATGKIGQFQISKKFDNTLIYENKNSRTQFLPDNYWENFDLSIERQDKFHCKLMLTFKSPETYYVSKKRKDLKVRLEGDENQLLEEKGLTLFPNLWRDQDKKKIELKGKSCEAKQIFFLIDDKKNEARFTAVVKNKLLS